MKTEHTPQWKSPTATLLRAERDHLKAANAEMLEALKQIHELWLCPGPRYTKDWAARCDVMADYARAAIAKAEGKE